MSRARHSQASTAATPSSTGTRLPDYEPPAHPLNPKAQRALQELIRNNSLGRLRKHLETAAQVITENAHEVNKTLHDRAQYVGKARAKFERDGYADDEERQRAEGLESHLEETRIRAEKMTKKMDESIRKIIDGEHGAENMERGLKVMSQQVVASSQRFAQSQRSMRRGTQTAEEVGDEDEDVPDFDPTDPGATARSGTSKAASFSLTEAFRTHLENERDRYQTRSLSERYAGNNHYASFKAHVHDGMHPDEDGPPLAHKSTWFNEGNIPAPGETGAGEGDSDDDIAIARERISTKCPLTLREYEDIVSSKKCKHSFERSAIMSLMGGSVGRRQVQCPVPGCNQQLTPNDLHVDDLLVKKVRRIQKSRKTQWGDDELATSPAHGSSGRAQSVNSDSGEDIEEVERKTQNAVPKPEPRSSRSRLYPDTPKSAAVVELGTGSTDGGASGDDDDR